MIAHVFNLCRTPGRCTYTLLRTFPCTAAADFGPLISTVHISSLCFPLISGVNLPHFAPLISAVHLYLRSTASFLVLLISAVHLCFLSPSSKLAFTTPVKTLARNPKPYRTGSEHTIPNRSCAWSSCNTTKMVFLDWDQVCNCMEHSKRQSTKIKEAMFRVEERERKREKGFFWEDGEIKGFNGAGEGR